MTATNHALTGAVIGLAIGNPWIAIPVAFGSHFVLDALPHFAFRSGKINTAFFRYYLLTEATLCGLIVLCLGVARPEYWWVAALCAFAAASPDFMWIARFVRAQKGTTAKEITHPIMRFHAWVQWCERPWGWTVEAVWMVAMITILVSY